MMSIFLEGLIVISLMLFGFLLLGLIIPIGYTLGSFISDKIESILGSF